MNPDQAAILLPNGTYANAGYMIDRIVNGGLSPQAVAQQMLSSQAAPGSLVQNGPASACGVGNPAANVAAAGGSTGGSTGGTGTSKGGNGSTLSMANNPLNSWLGGVSASLSSIQNQIVSVGGGTTTSGANGVSRGATTGATGGTCSSIASATLSSSLNTLQGVAATLAGSNVSPAVLTSLQNLVSAVAQVLTSLSSCIANGQ